MPIPSKFNPKSNPIATQNLEETYLVTADNLVIEQFYANVILGQPNLEISQLDPGLGTLINAYQSRMRSSANFFLIKLVPGFIDVVTDTSNFSDLVIAFSSIGRQNILNAFEDTKAAKSASTSLGSLADSAGEVWVDTNTLNSSYSASERTLSTYAKSYDNSLTKAIDLLSESSKQIAKDIDDLQEAINQNIKDIVEGGKELGDAVTQLGIGILTTISGAATEPIPKDDDDDDDESGNEDENSEDKNEPKAPNVEFAVQAIQAGTSGTTRASAAMKALDANNKKLAVAYQQMAQENVLVTIAKVVQVQNKLFMDTLIQFGLNIHDLSGDWAMVESSYTDFSKQITNLKSHSEAIKMAAEVAGAKALWNALGSQLEYIKSSLTGIL